MLQFGSLVSLVNLVICLIISIFAYLYYKKSKSHIHLFLSISFGLFGFSHFLILFDSTKEILTLLEITRMIAYFLIIISLFKIIKLRWYTTLTVAIITLGIFLSSFYQSPALRLSLLNLIFCLIIVTASCLIYKKSLNKIPFYLAISFGMFAITHIGMLLGFQEHITAAIIIIRSIAYIVILCALYSFVETQISNFTLKYLSDIKLQLIFVGIATSIIFLMFYIPHLKFNCSDPKLKINPINPKTTEELITEVKTGLFVKNFPLFDINKNEFIINAIFWFEFDPHAISLDSIKKFTFEKGIILKKSNPETKIINDKLFSRFKVRIQFKSDLDYSLFPLEDHRINLMLINTTLNPDEVIISSRNTNLTSKDQIFTGDWIMVSGNVEYGYSKSEIDKFDPKKTSFYPTVLYSLDFRKAGMKQTFIIFVPLFLAFFLGIFSLLVSIKNKGGILALSVGSVSSLIYDLFVILRISPNVRYFTITDSIFTMLLFSVFIILLFNVYIIKQIKEKLVSKTLILLRSYIFLFFVIFIPLITYYILYTGRV